MSKEVYEKLDGRVVCGDGGSPVLITGVDVVERMNKTTNEKKAVLQITGLAKGVLNNPANPGAGYETLEEPVVIVHDWDVLSKDPTIFFKNLNMALGLEGEEALVDDGVDWLDRFAEDSENSVIDKLKNTGLYFSMKAKENMEKALQYNDFPMWSNVFVPPKREVATKATLSELRQKLKEKVEREKEAKDGLKDVLGNSNESPF